MRLNSIKTVKPETVMEALLLTEVPEHKTLSSVDFYVPTVEGLRLPEGWTKSDSDGGYYKYRR